MAAIAVAHEIGIVFIEANFRTKQFGQMLRAGHQDPFTRAVLGEQFVERAAFWSAIFRVGVIVVEAGTVPEHKVALDFNKTEFPLGVLGEVICLIGILPEFANAKPAHVSMRILALVVPTHPDTRFSGAADERNRFGDDIQFFSRVPEDADLRFQSELDEGRHEFS